MARLDLRDLKNLRALWVVFGSMAAQMAMGYTYLRNPLAPSMIEEMGWGRGEMSLAASPGTIVTALASPVAGFLTQRYGARPVVTFGVLLPALIGWGFSGLTTLWQFFLLNVASGCMIASVGDVAVGYVVSKWVNAGRGVALGIVYSGSNLGGFLAATAGTLLLAPVGWRQAYLLVGVACSVLLLPIILAAVREPRPDFIPASLREAANEGNLPPAEGIPLREAVRTPSFWLLAVALFLFYVYFIGVNGHFTLHLVDVGFTKREAGQLFAELVFLGVFAKIGIGLIADRWPAKVALLVNFALLIAASILLVGIGDDRDLVRPFVIAHGCATMAQNVVFPLIVAWCFGTRYLAEIYGILMLALLPGGIFGPVLLGYMHDWLHSYQLPFQALVAVNIICFAMLAAVRPFSSLTPREPAPAEAS
jgi:MFS family permease